MPVRCKVHRSGRETLVAACDTTLVGKTLQEGRLALFVSEAFYGTDVVDESTLVAQLSACTIANLVGETAVAVAIRHGFVDANAVLVIAGIPHAQMATL